MYIVKGLIITGLFLLLFSCYSYLYHFSGYRFNSPDETAVFYFLSEFLSEGKLYYEDTANQWGEGLVHPRSMLAFGNKVVPITFPAFFLIFGAVGLVLGLKSLVYVVPFLSVLTVFAFFYIIKQFWGRRVAMISAFVLALHPAFIYYTARGFLPNALFVDLFILGIFFLVKCAVSLANKENYTPFIYCFLAVFLIDYARSVRPFELIWMWIVVGAVFIYYKDWYALIWKKIIAIWLGVAIFFTVVVLGLNWWLYGNPFSSGYYIFSNRSVEVVETAPMEKVKAELTKVKKVDLHNISSNFYCFLVYVFPWFAILATLGAVNIFYDKRLSFRNCGNWRERFKNLPFEIKYIFIFLAVMAILLVFYGSWNFTDNISGNVTIGNSYVRYFLPIYIMGIPLVAVFLNKFLVKRSLLVSALGIMSVWSVIAVWSGEDGIASIRKNFEQYARTRAIVLQKIAKDSSIIISERSDKIFFPDLRVISIPEKNYAILGRPVSNLLNNGFNVYFYTEMKDEDIAYFRDRYFKDSSLVLEKKVNLDDGFNLWEIKKIYGL